MELQYEVSELHSSTKILCLLESPQFLDTYDSFSFYSYNISCQNTYTYTSKVENLPVFIFLYLSCISTYTKVSIIELVPN